MTRALSRPRKQVSPGLSSPGFQRTSPFSGSCPRRCPNMPGNGAEIVDIEPDYSDFVPRNWGRTLDPGSFEIHREILLAIYRLSGSDKVLDLGCGEAHVTQNLDSTLVDLVNRPNPKVPVITMDFLAFPKTFPMRHYGL